MQTTMFLSVQMVSESYLFDLFAGIVLNFVNEVNSAQLFAVFFFFSFFYFGRATVCVFVFSFFRIELILVAVF